MGTKLTIWNVLTLFSFLCHLEKYGDHNRHLSYLFDKTWLFQTAVWKFEELQLYYFYEKKQWMRYKVNSLLTLLKTGKEKNWNSEWTMKRFNENSYILLVIVSYLVRWISSFRNSPGLMNFYFLAHTHSLRFLVLDSVSTLLSLLLWIISFELPNLTHQYCLAILFAPQSSYLWISYHYTCFMHLLLVWFPLISLLKAFPPPLNSNQKQCKTKQNQNNNNKQTKPTRIVWLINRDDFL